MRIIACRTFVAFATQTLIQEQNHCTAYNVLNGFTNPAVIKITIAIEPSQILIFYQLLMPLLIRPLPDPPLISPLTVLILP